MLDPKILQSVKQQLATFANQDSFGSLIEQTFGNKVDQSKLLILRHQWLAGDFSFIPEIEILWGELGTANGAYGASTNKIYLSARFLAVATAQEVASTLLEEIGHAIDNLINNQDTIGDEGAIFSQFVQGNHLTVTELSLLRAEDDHAYIFLNNQRISVEQQNIIGDDNDNTLPGTATNDFIDGQGGDDVLSGLGGNDTINGGSGNDTIAGGTGNDVIVFDYYQDSDVVTDFVRGQDKIDVRNIKINDWEVLETLITNDGAGNALITTYYGGRLSQLKLQGINPTLLQASDFIVNNILFNDVRDGNDQYSDQLFGGLGNDTINGFRGSDFLYGEQGNDFLNGGDDDDTLIGGAGNDIFNGGSGDDQIKGEVGSDVIVFDYYQDSDVITDFVRGQDKIDVRNIKINDWEVLETLITNDGAGNALITTYYGGRLSQLKLQGINPTLLQASDFIVNNILFNDVRDGNDQYSDQLFGGLGNDTINGFRGSDFLYGEQGNDFLNGGDDDDTLIGGAGNDIFNGGSGDDNLEGGFDNDTAIYGGTRLQYQVTNVAGVFTITDTVANRDGIDTLRGIQKIKFSDQTITIAPVEATVTLAVTPVAVTEDGISNLLYTFTRTGPTTDPLTVKYTVAGTGVFNTDYTQTGAASFSATTGTITFAANSATATLLIDPKADTTIEGDETVAIKLATAVGYTIGTTTPVTGTILNDDTLNRTGINLSINNITVVEGRDANALLTISLSGISSQPISVNYTTTSINATANGDYTTKTGTLIIPANTLTATISIPILNDNLNEVDESFVVTLSNPINATINPDAGIAEVTITDTLRSAISRILPSGVENLTLTGVGAINGTGNAGNNIILGNIASNTINGGAGNDYLNGSLGADTMIGGTGNDTFIIDNAGDLITESSALLTEIDTAQSSVTYALVANVEKLFLIGGGAINGTGNALNNTLVGNGASNILNGGIGSDTLTSGAGNDILTFQFGQSSVNAPDRITDFTIGADKIDLLGLTGNALATPTLFSRAGDSTATTLSALATQVFADANGAIAGNQGLGLNGATLVKVNVGAIAGTYLVINDNVAGFQANNDLLINITGTLGTLPTVGTIPANSFFI
jgi:Ca2+-binding RTX toxin-like protein